jgi:hypothetical protein
MVGCFCRSGCVAEVAGLYFIERARGHFGELTRAGHGFLVDFFLFFTFLSGLLVVQSVTGA